MIGFTHKTLIYPHTKSSIINIAQSNTSDHKKVIISTSAIAVDQMLIPGQTQTTEIPITLTSRLETILQEENKSYKMIGTYIDSKPEDTKEELEENT